jgi:GNAT superfamily N-acetyltransferase
MSTNSTGDQCAVVPLTQELLERAADLFVADYERARSVQPLLPVCHADKAEILGKLTGLSGREEGVAVMDGGRLLGYGIGFGGDEWHGWPAVFMPEWGHSTVPEDRPAIYRVLYTALSRQWAGNGRLCHLVCMPSAGAALDEWQWMGFGLQCVDALRDLNPAAGKPAACAVRRAGPQDAAVVAELMNGLRRHLAEGPVFLPDPGPASPDAVHEQLADPARACYLAQTDDRPVGYMTVRSGDTGGAWLVQDTGTAGIDGACTVPECRRCGVGTALLNAIIDWARERGHVRLAVDFEAHNALARAFWLRHFEPVAWSVARYVRHPHVGKAT